MLVSDNLSSISRHFEIDGEIIDSKRITSGHIHETFIATYAKADAASGETFRRVHQKLNTHVFRDLGGLMENLQRVTEHLRSKLMKAKAHDLERRALCLVPAREGGFVHVDADGHPWRTLDAIEGAHTVSRVEGPDQACQAAHAFGKFTAMLNDLPPPPLVDTIPGFHSLALRFSQLEEALREDPFGRAGDARREAEQAGRGFREVSERLASGHASALPRRIVHHDCKVNNVMLDDTTGEGLCVIDLDTVMVGNVLSDFGELVRTTTCRAPEDERDLERIRMDPELFLPVARGYLAGTGGLLTDAELRLMPLAGPLFALMNAIRFLTDHLQGDVYFRIHREGHNLDRSRAQQRLFERMMDQQPLLTQLLEQGAVAAHSFPRP
jgi:Ser/Thr protein kinase RdoA (MazF antagonist)